MFFSILSYRSPVTETSSHKGIPIEFRNHYKIRTLVSLGWRVVYRGPRRKTFIQGRMVSDPYTLKSNAVTFTLYPPVGR